MYALGVGCGPEELKWVWEGAGDFQCLPSMAVIPAFAGMMSVPMDRVLADFQPHMLLHGEQFVELMDAEGGMPVEGELQVQTRVVEVAEKAGKGTVVVAQVSCKDVKTGKIVAIAEGTTFNRKARPAVKCSANERRPLAVSPVPRVSGPPVKVHRQLVSSGAAALYRLSGDANPLHIDPGFAKAAGFPRPILHGLCTLGMATHHVACAFPQRRIKAIRVRFVKHVFPGEQIETQMWPVDDDKVVLKVIAVDRQNEPVIDQAFIQFFGAETKSSSSIAKSTSKSTTKTTGEVEAFVEGLKSKFEGLPEKFRSEQVKKIGGVFEFSVEGRQFHIDLKNGLGAISGGPPASKADISLTMGKTADFLALAGGHLKGQEAFMKGLVKVKGNMMLAMKLDGLFKALRSTDSKL